MADVKKKCPCRYSRELRDRLEAILAEVEKVSLDNWLLRNRAEEAVAFLKEWDDAEAEASRCQHCGLPGGH